MSSLDWEKLREEALGPFTLQALPPTLKLPALPQLPFQHQKRLQPPPLLRQQLLFL